MQSEQQDSILQGGQRNALRNDSHLPECRCAKHHHAPEPWCDCDRLRACEQRVKKHTLKAMAPFLITEKDELIRINYQSGYRTALLDVREAVAKIPKEDGGYCHVLHACDVEDAINDLRTTDKPQTSPDKAKSADLYDPQWGEMIH